MTKKLSYVLIGDPMAVAGTMTKKEPMLSGLWLWSVAFDRYGKRGDVRLIRSKEELEEYDIVHINLTAGDLALPLMIRDELGSSSSTKLVVNMDFDPMLWGQVWDYPKFVEKALQAADMVFQVDSIGAGYIERMINRKVYCLPHPVDVDGLDKYKKIDREPTIVTMWNRYIPDCTTAYYAQRDVPAFKILLGYRGKIHNIGMFDKVFGYIPFLNAIEIMSRAKFGYDMYMGYSYGRTVVEFAALAVPCICSNTIEAARKLFPSTSVHPLDIKKQHELFWKLIKDDEEYIRVFKFAYDAAKEYKLKNSYEKMVSAIEEVEEQQSQNGDVHFSDEWKVIQERYERRTNEPKPENYLQFARDLARQFKEWVGVQGLVLDIGCGNGKYAGGTYESMGHEYLSRENQIIGLDPLKSYETRFPVVRAFGEYIPFQDEIFDAVTIVSTLDHIEDPMPVLKEAKRVLKKGGRIFIQNSIRERGINPWHLHTWTKEELTELVDEVFTVIDRKVIENPKMGDNIFIKGTKK